MPANIDKLRNLELPDATGGRTRFDSFWKQSPAVFAFLRHYG